MEKTQFNVQHAKFATNSQNVGTKGTVGKIILVIAQLTNPVKKDDKCKEEEGGGN